MQVKGGKGPEAIEIGLNHANLEYDKNPISQIILIGDAPANSKEEVEKNRLLYGENYWKTTKFYNLTNYLNEIDKLIAKKVPVNTFYLNHYAKLNFEEISKLTNGVCNSLVINSNDGEKLTEMVSKSILSSIAFISNIDSKLLVDEYNKRFNKSYIWLNLNK